MLLRLFLFVSILSLLSGCANLVSHQITHASSYSFSDQKNRQIMTEFGIRQLQHCDQVFGCYSYYFGQRTTEKNLLSMENVANFTGKPHQTTIRIERSDITLQQGAIVLVHGFRGSKEWMTVNMGYFQFLGFDVYALDLLGHGDSKGSKGFGVTDADYVARFVDAVIPNNVPVYGVGTSMGGLVVVRAAQRGAFDAIVLQAPMTQFDDALVGYMSDRDPWYRAFLGEKALREGAHKALIQASVSMEQTNLAPLLSHIQVPVLLFSSQIDSVSPYHYFAALDFEHVHLVNVGDVEHAYMSMIGQREHAHIYRFLSALAKQ